MGKPRDINPNPEEGKCPGLKKDGSACKLSAGFGTDHLGYGRCRFHAGNSKPAREEAREEAATKAAAMFGLPREVDPYLALIEELHRSAGHVAWLQSHIANLERASDLTQAVGGGQGGLAESKPAVWVTMYNEERKHFKDVAKTCIAAGIAERQVKLAEDQGRLIAQVLQGVLRDLGVADRPEVPEVVRRHLSLVSGGRAA